MYITTERKMTFKRPKEIALHNLSAQQTDLSSPVRGVGAILDNIHTIHAPTIEAFETLLFYGLPIQFDKMAAETGGDRLPIRTLVIDSIGSLYRSSFEAGGLFERSKALCQIADRLKELAVAHDVAVVTINQVADVFHGEISLEVPSRTETPVIPQDSLPSSAPTSGSLPIDPTEFWAASPGGSKPPMAYKAQSQYFSGQTKSNHKEASLGLVWANAVNVRIMLSRTGRRRLLEPEDLAWKKTRTSGSGSDDRQEGDMIEDADPTLIRRLHLVFSPFAPAGFKDFVILTSGMHSLTEGSDSKQSQPQTHHITGTEIGDPSGRSTTETTREDAVDL